MVTASGKQLRAQLLKVTAGTGMEILLRWKFL